MTQKVMRLLDPDTGLMECRVCWSRHVANIRAGGHYFRGSWQCRNRCTVPAPTPKAMRKVLTGDSRPHGAPAASPMVE